MADHSNINRETLARLAGRGQNHNQGINPYHRDKGPMAEYSRTVTRAGYGSSAIDEGLRAYLNRVYGLMAIGMLVTAAVAFFIANTPTLLMAIYGSPLKWVVMFAPLAVVFLLSARIHHMSASAAQATFFVYSALVGASISYILVRYTGVSIAQTFLMTAIAFLGLSIYGMTTKSDLSGMGRFLVMGVIGLIVASIVNIFLGSSMLQFTVSVIGILIFAGLTAYETQTIKNEYLMFAQAGAEGQAWLGKGAIMGALSLYINFLNMFMFLLQFAGIGNSEE